MKEWIIRWSLYLLAVSIAILYSGMEEATDWIYGIAFLPLCIILYDWASIRAKDVQKFAKGRKDYE